MRPAHVAMTLVCACVVAATSAPASYFVYAPRPTEEGAPEGQPAQQLPKTAEHEILVKEITIQRGDTLSSISRTFSGHASYFPQILLFNKISDPDLIFEGNSLRVPVTRETAEVKKERHAGAAGKVKKKKKKAKRQKSGAASAPSQPAPAAPSEAQRTNAPAEQRLYGRGVEAYRMGRCEEAISLFDTFLRHYPDAPSAPDASLLRADCRLKLSEQ